MLRFVQMRRAGDGRRPGWESRLERRAFVDEPRGPPMGGDARRGAGCLGTTDVGVGRGPIVIDVDTDRTPVTTTTSRWRSPARADGASSSWLRRPTIRTAIRKRCCGPAGCAAEAAAHRASRRSVVDGATRERPVLHHVVGRRPPVRRLEARADRIAERSCPAARRRSALRARRPGLPTLRRRPRRRVGRRATTSLRSAPVRSPAGDRSDVHRGLSPDRHPIDVIESATYVGCGHASITREPTFDTVARLANGAGPSCGSSVTRRAPMIAVGAPVRHRWVPVPSPSWLVRHARAPCWSCPSARTAPGTCCTGAGRRCRSHGGTTTPAARTCRG